MSYQIGLFAKTMQDFRNELQEISFKEINRMQITGETSVSNFINKLLNKLDEEYGTQYERTKSVEEAVSNGETKNMET